MQANVKIQRLQIRLKDAQMSKNAFLKKSQRVTSDEYQRELQKVGRQHIQLVLLLLLKNFRRFQGRSSNGSVLRRTCPLPKSRLPSICLTRRLSCKWTLLLLISNLLDFSKECPRCLATCLFKSNNQYKPSIRLLTIQNSQYHWIRLPLHPQTSVHSSRTRLLSSDSWQTRASRFLLYAADCLSWPARTWFASFSLMHISFTTGLSSTASSCLFQLSPLSVAAAFRLSLGAN